jgi:predicted short-subunit dehydrogenase-like oxidoreductase (DUF2520 family)
MNSKCNLEELNVVLLGAGNVATHLGRALHAAGINITCVYSRTLSHAQELAVEIGAKGVNQVTDLPCADVYLFAVKDDVLGPLVIEVAQYFPQSCFVHTAGSISLSVFDGCVENAAVMYPMQTFSKSLEVSFKGLPIYAEATNESAYDIVAQMALMIGAKVTPLSSEKRKYLHLAVVFACNFANHCYTLASQVMEQADLPFEDLIPLIEMTTRKLRLAHPIDGQTGPAVRGDQVVMEKQNSLLTDAEMLRQIYSLMSESIYHTAQSRKDKCAR